MLQLTDKTVRYFTLREQAYLQTFPNSYKLPATVSKATKQIGNACPVKLAQVFGGSILRVLKTQSEAFPPNGPWAIVALCGKKRKEVC